MATRQAATSALKDLKEDFPDAQVIEVSQAKPKGEKVDIGNAETLDTEELQELDNLSGDEYVKKSRSCRTRPRSQATRRPRTTRRRAAAATHGDRVSACDEHSSA